MLDTEGGEAQSPADGEAVHEDEVQGSAEGEGEQQSLGGTPQADPPQKEPARKPWFQERIDELTRQKNDEKRERERLKAELDAAKALIPKGEGAPAAAERRAEPENLDDVIAQRAEELAAAKAFNDAANKSYAKGVKDIGDDFKGSVAQLNAAGVMTREFVETVLDTDAPEKVLHHLGQDPEEAMRIAKLPERRRAIELDRLATKLAAPVRPVSKAPDPITPVTGTSKAAFDPDGDFTMDEFLRWRDSQRKKG